MASPVRAEAEPRPTGSIRQRAERVVAERYNATVASTTERIDLLKSEQGKYSLLEQKRWTKGGRRRAGLRVTSFGTQIAELEQQKQSDVRDQEILQEIIDRRISRDIYQDPPYKDYSTLVSLDANGRKDGYMDLSRYKNYRDGGYFYGGKLGDFDTGDDGQREGAGSEAEHLYRLYNRVLREVETEAYKLPGSQQKDSKGRDGAGVSKFVEGNVA